MCGIAGAVGAIDDAVIRDVGRAAGAMRHRGPDAEGLWIEPSEQPRVVLAHRRLTIIDPNPEANQPMVDPQGGAALCYNGEVYNFESLRDELRDRGVQFRTRSDTEVVLQGLIHWGEAAVERFRGMFAFAAWLPERQTLVLARDRLGIKPLYVYRERRDDGQETLFFASELRSLLATDRVPRRLDPEGLACFLWNGFAVGPGTLVRDVELLPAATTRSVEAPTLRATTRRYWDLPPSTGTTTTGELQEALEDAVRMRLVSDVPLGIFLSGGIDSSAVTSLARRRGDGELRTINLAFEETGFDESPYARQIARALGTDHHEIRLRGGEFRERLQGALRCLDQPTFDAINTYLVSHAAREAGLTVVLSGAGGDELFGGYSSFVDLPRARRAVLGTRWLPRQLRRLAGRAIARIKLGPPGEVPPQTRWGKLGDVLASGGSLLELHQLNYALFLPDLLEELSEFAAFERAPLGISEQLREELLQRSRGRPTLDAISALELSCFVGERLLPHTDMASMGCSVEVRVPLLDHLVVETAFGLPTATRFEPLRRKQVLRDVALGEIDPGVFERPKSGFVLPIERWCQNELRDEVEAAFADRDHCEACGLDADTIGRIWHTFRSGGPGLYWSRVWNLYVLLWWCREHHVSR